MSMALRSFPALILSLTVCACAGQSQGFRSSGPAAEPAQITIENQSTNPVDVFIVFNDQTFRLDQVFALDSTTVEIPRFVTPTGSIRALVDPLGSTDAYLSDPVAYLGNEDFLLTIQSQLALTTFIPVSRDRQ